MTSTFEHTRPMVCPACVGLPENVASAKGPSPNANIILTLPHIHCAACISGVESTLARVPGVNSARVNLTLRRVAIDAAADLDPDSLIAVLGQAGFEAQSLDVALIASGGQDDYGRMLLMRLGVAGFAMMNVMLLSVAVWSGAEAATRDMMHWISAAIALPAVAFAGVPFYTSAYSALRANRLNMDVPITLAIVLAAGTSLFETFHGGEHAYFDAAITLAFFLLTGRYLEHRTRASARSAAQELAALEVHKAITLVGGTEVSLPLGEVRVGDIVLVRVGANVPVDGEILEGCSEIDRSLMTGETLPVVCEAGTKVHAGEINLTGPLTMRALAVGADTELRRISDLVALAESGRSRYASLADRAAKLYAPGVHILSLFAAIGWFLYTQDVRISLNIAAAVLIITCPCALGLAVPAVTTAVSGRLYKRGVLVKHETALERLAEVDTVIFDKTGTLTLGHPVPADLAKLDKRARSVLYALTQGSEHPLARAVCKVLAANGVAPANVQDVQEIAGRGLEGVFEGQLIRFGHGAWVGMPASGATQSYLQIGQAAPMKIEFDEHLRDGAQACVQELMARGVNICILSGDTHSAVKKVASNLGGVPFQAGLFPDQKSDFIGGLQDAGKHVLMIGDGLNDTAALTTAQVSMSPASALNAARTASDFVLIDQSLKNVTAALDLAQQARLRIKQNLTIASLYNVVAVPLAVAGMATPLIAALAMSLSSLTVTLNALRLKG